MQRFDPKFYEHSMCVSYNTSLHTVDYDKKLVVYHEMLKWCAEAYGARNYLFHLEDYGQHGEWMLYVHSREDLLAFKLRWCDK